MSSPFTEKSKRVKELIKGYMQEAPNLLTVYMFEQMGQDIGNEEKPPRNMTNQLRIQSGRLSRSFTPNESGNIANMVQKGDVYFLQYGINLREVPYARVHEYGYKERGLRARPYLRPGFDAFVEKEVPRFIQRLIKVIES